MTYQDFKKGLFVKFHLTCLKSTPFIKFVYHSDTSAKFENPIILMADAESLLRKINNRNMVKALCLMAQGYCQWEVGEMMGKSERTIRRYIAEVINIYLDN